MGVPVFLVESFFSAGAGLQYPGHAVSATEEPSGGEAWRVATGRRRQSDAWTMTSANTEGSVMVTCDRLRAANMMALDRGHNLAGKRVVLEGSADDFVTSAPLVDVTLPPGTMLGADVSGGVVTEEGAYLKSFPADAFTGYRLRIPAGGAGFVPRVVGLWVGLAWQPLEYAARPFRPDMVAVQFSESTTPSGWSGRGLISSPRRGEVLLRLADEVAYEPARIFGGHWTLGRPAWVVPDDEAAATAFLATAPPGGFGFGFEPGEWSGHQGSISYVEHEPRRRA